MKIGIFDPYLDTMSGGEKYMLSIASCLASSNEVFIFWDKEKEIREEAYRKLGIDLSLVKFYSNIFSPKVSFLNRIISSRKFDKIIYLSDGSIPLVWTKLYIHFQFPVEWVNGPSLKTKLKFFSVSKIFCNSKFTKYFIDKKFHLNSDVLYPPVYFGNIEDNKKENVILHVGRFYENKEGANYKKQDVMIDSFKRMVDKGLKEWKLLLIVGVKKEDEDKLVKLNKFSLGYPIEIIKNPSNKELWEWYSRSKIYWHATGFEENLEKYPEKAEHFGISTVEAMGAGAVPVVINAGGQREIVDDKKNGFLWESLEDLIENTNKLIKDDDLWKKMSQEAIRKSKVFGGDKFCSELKDIIK